MGLFEGVPGLREAEDALGTAATGTVDTLVADPGNALLGVDADNMGIFEEGSAGSKTISIGSFGLAGHSGIITDPGDFADDVFGSGQQQQQQQQPQRSTVLGTNPWGIIALISAIIGALIVVSK